VHSCFLVEGVAMPLTIPDSLLEQVGWTEQDARLDLACRLFQTRRLRLWQAAQWAGLSRVEMEAELLRRGIARYEVTKDQVDAELAAMDRLGIPPADQGRVAEWAQQLDRGRVASPLYC
jgi:predicted HTH domain antitoxin